MHSNREKNRKSSFLLTLRRRRWWKRMNAVLSIIVIIATCSGLMLPAVTLAKEECTLKEHLHTKECYTTGYEYACSEESLGVHKHTEELAEAQEAAQSTEPAAAEAATEPTETAPAENPVESTVPVQEEESPCPLPELEAHAHTEECYAEDETLLCEKIVIMEHQHDESCLIPINTMLTCKLTEHKHTELCRTPSELSEVVAPEMGVLDEEAQKILAEGLNPRIFTHTHHGEDYTLTASYGEEASLPEDVKLVVEELLPESEAYIDYYEQVNAALPEEEIVYVRIFDVTFYDAEGQMVEPNATVKLEIVYDESLEVEANAKAQVVHFAQDGTEVLPAEVDTSEEGGISIQYAQDSFSVGAVVLSVDNMDKGTDKLLIDWYVYLDGAWTKVGSTRTGWLAAGDETHDYISEAQAIYMLEKYGFQGGDLGWEALAYRKIKNYGADPIMLPGVWSVNQGKDMDGKIYYQLSNDNIVDSYEMYYVPAAYQKIDSANGTEADLHELFGDDINVYSITVSDPQEVKYAADELRPTSYAIHDKDTVIKLKGDVDEWCVKRTTGLHISDVIKIEPDAAPPVGKQFYGWNNGDGTCTIFLTNVKQPMLLKVCDQNHTVAESTPIDDLLVNYWVNLDGTWTKVGTTYLGWSIDARKENSRNPYLDMNYQQSQEGGGYIRDIHNDEGPAYYARDVIDMRQIETILGPYGFTARTAEDVLNYQSSSANTDKKTGQAITNLAYEKLKLKDDGSYEPETDKVFYDVYYHAYVNNDDETVMVYPLSQSDTRAADDTPQSCDAYNIYFVPKGFGTVGGSKNLTDAKADPNTLLEKVPVNFYVHLDGAWTNVGTIDYIVDNGINQHPDGRTEFWRDYVTMDQVKSILGKYGFTTGPVKDTSQANARNLAYGTNGNYWTDTWTAVSSHGIPVYPLSKDASEWKVFYLPGNKAQFTSGYTAAQGGPDNAHTNIGSLNNSYKFYKYYVFEPSRSVYTSIHDTPKTFVQHGQTGSLTVKSNKGLGNVLPWVVKDKERKELILFDGDISDAQEGTYVKTYSEDGSMVTISVPNMTEPHLIGFSYSNGDRSLSNNYADEKNSINGLVEDPGIQFTVHNYSTTINKLLANKGLIAYDSSGGVDLTRTFFSFRGDGGETVAYNALMDNDPLQLNHATVKRNLEIDAADGLGYPVLDVTHHGYTTKDKLNTYNANNQTGAVNVARWEELVNDPPSLGFLFGQKDTDLGGDGNSYVTAESNQKTNPYVISYKSVNTPLQNYHGNYQYFSYFNAADFNTRNMTWYVRNYIERTQSTSGHISKDDYGDFLPFNHSSGELISGKPFNFYTKDVDYWFGMTMRNKFYLPKDGLTDSGEPILFSFSGDDDVYVFVDGKLVLDIGGTHGACTGFINFSTGLVASYYDFNGQNDGNKTMVSTVPGDTITDPYDTSKKYQRYYSTTIYETYKAAFIEQGMTEAAAIAECDKIFEPVLDENDEQVWVSDYWDGKLNADGKVVTTDAEGKETVHGVILGERKYPVYRFRNYEPHSLDYFYMERGSSVANCNIRFNLPVISSEGFTVGKSLEYQSADGDTITEDDKSFYTNTEKYTFRIVDDKNRNILTDLVGTQLDVLNADNQIVGSVTVDSNGCFKLSAGQRVSIEEINKMIQSAQASGVYVQELLPVGHHTSYDNIEVNGEAATRPPDGVDKQVVINSVTYDIYEKHYDINVLAQSAIFSGLSNRIDLRENGYLRVQKTATGGDTTTAEKKFKVQVLVNGSPVPEGTHFYPVDPTTGIANYQPNASAGEYRLSADAQGCITINAGEIWQMGPKLIKDYTYQVLEKDIPEGWSLDGYSSWELQEGALTSKVNKTEKKQTAEGTIKDNTYSVVEIINKTAAISLDITVSKQFLGMLNNDTANQVTRSATISAVQVKDKTGTALAAGDVYAPETISPVIISCTGITANTDTIHLAYESGTLDGDYFYKIWESGTNVQPGEVFLNDDSVYIIQVTVGRDTEGKQTAKITAIYQNGTLISGTDGTNTITNGSTTLKFINRMATYELPLTGGSGTNRYMISGLALMLTALVALMYINKYRMHRGGKMISFNSISEQTKNL